MKLLFEFTVPGKKDPNIAMDELATYDIEDLLLVESFDGSPHLIYGRTSQSKIPVPWLSYAQPISQKTNWDSQWADFSPFYSEGICKVPLSIFGIDTQEHLVLDPGPGFGDLSHPTTRLVLQMMAPHVQGKHIIDLGCGSGILGLAALKMGALSVVGVEIDSYALEHATHNAKINQCEDRWRSAETLLEIREDAILLMNMTFYEQKDALPPSLPVWITSGILEEQKDAYLTWVRAQGLSCIQHQQEDIWGGYLLQRSQP